MTDKKQTENNPSQSTTDLVILAVIVVFVFILSYFFNAFNVIVLYSQHHPEKIVYIDEILSVLTTLSLGLAVFSWRRWSDLKKETSKRIKHQEELLKMTSTQAETERIISKQLRLDMDQMKQDVRDLLFILRSKNQRPL